MKCVFKLENSEMCNRPPVIPTKFCLKHQNSLQARENAQTIVRLGGIDFLMYNRKISSYLEGLKIHPLHPAHISLLEEKGFGSFIDVAVKNRLN